MNWNLFIRYLRGSLCQLLLNAYFTSEVWRLMFQGVGLLFILECKLCCLGVKHGLVVGGGKKNVENEVLGKY